MVTVTEAESQIAQQRSAFEAAKKQIQSTPTRVVQTKTQLLQATPSSQAQVRSAEQQMELQKQQALQQIQQEEQYFNEQAKIVEQQISDYKSQVAAQKRREEAISVYNLRLAKNPDDPAAAEYYAKQIDPTLFSEILVEPSIQQEFVVPELSETEKKFLEGVKSGSIQGFSGIPNLTPEQQAKMNLYTKAGFIKAPEPSEFFISKTTTGEKILEKTRQEQLSKLKPSERLVSDFPKSYEQVGELPYIKPVSKFNIISNLPVGSPIGGTFVGIGQFGIGSPDKTISQAIQYRRNYLSKAPETYLGAAEELGYRTYEFGRSKTLGGQVSAGIQTGLMAGSTFLPTKVLVPFGVYTGISGTTKALSTKLSKTERLKGGIEAGVSALFLGTIGYKYLTKPMRIKLGKPKVEAEVLNVIRPTTEKKGIGTLVGAVKREGQVYVDLPRWKTWLYKPSNEMKLTVDNIPQVQLIPKYGFLKPKIVEGFSTKPVTYVYYGKDLKIVGQKVFGTVKKGRLTDTGIKNVQDIILKGKGEILYKKPSKIVTDISGSTVTQEVSLFKEPRSFETKMFKQLLKTGISEKLGYPSQEIYLQKGFAKGMRKPILRIENVVQPVRAGMDLTSPTTQKPNIRLVLKGRTFKPSQSQLASISRYTGKIGEDIYVFTGDTLSKDVTLARPRNVIGIKEGVIGYVSKSSKPTSGKGLRISEVSLLLKGKPESSITTGTESVFDIPTKISRFNEPKLSSLQQKLLLRTSPTLETPSVSGTQLVGSISSAKGIIMAPRTTPVPSIASIQTSPISSLSSSLSTTLEVPRSTSTIVTTSKTQTNIITTSRYIYVPKELELFRQIEIPRQVQVPRQVQIPKSIQVPRETQIPRSTQVFRQVQVPRQIQISKQVQASRQTFVPKTTTPPTKTIIPKLPSKVPSLTILKRREPQIKIEPTFEVQVRRRGKFQRVSERLLPRGKAIKLGVTRTKTGVAQTFRLVPKGSTVAAPDIGFEVPRSLYTTLRKPQPNTYVERRGKTLTERPEVRELLSIKRSKRFKLF